MPTRQPAEYAVDRDALEAAATQLKVPLTTIRALVAFFTKDLMFPNGVLFVEMSEERLRAAGLALTEAQQEATGAELFTAFYAVNRDAAVNAGRFGPFHLCGSLRSNCGLSTAASFKAAIVDGNTTRNFTAFVRLLRDTGLAADLQNKHWSAFAQKYAALNVLPDVSWPTSWSSNFDSHMSYLA